MRSRLLAAALAVLASAACSSAPPASDVVNQTKERAAAATAAGNRYFHEGRYEIALIFFRQALQENTSIDNDAGMVLSSNSIARVYMATGKTDAAERILKEVLPQALKPGNEVLCYVTCDNLGQLYLRKEDPERAIESFTRALSLPQGKLTPAQTAVLSHDLGTAYKSSGDYSRAMELFGKSLAINLAGKLHEEAAADYYMMASLHSKQEDYAKAEEDLVLALEQDKLIENSPGIAKDLYALGLVAGKRSDAEAAYGYFRRSFLVYSTIGYKPDIRKALQRLISAAENAGRTEEAAEYGKALSDLGD
jgi:tetratricopeptide (TPR) repeat protein